MIYKNSHDPVYIKKISVKVWSVRDEIEEVIKHRLEQVSLDEATKNLPKEELKNILRFKELDQEYNTKYDPAKALTELTSKSAPSAPLDPLEAEMLKAIGGEEAIAPTTPIAEGQAPSEVQAPVEGQTPEAAAAAGAEVAQAPVAPTLEATVAPNDSAAPAEILSPGLRKEGEVIQIVQRHPHIDDQHIALGRLILSEISADHMFIFVDKKFIEGQNIRIEFLIPRHFIISAQVKYCRKFSIKSKVIRETRLVYRMMAKFTFERAGERTLLRQFLKSISPDLSNTKKAQAKAAPSGGGELDDLDL